MFVASGIWCLADVSSVSPSSEQTGELWSNQCFGADWGIVGKSVFCPQFPSLLRRRANARY